MQLTQPVQCIQPIATMKEKKTANIVGFHSVTIKMNTGIITAINAGGIISKLHLVIMRSVRRKYQYMHRIAYL
jgi:hypothetical protein